MSASINVARAKGSLSAAFADYLTIGGASRQEQHAATVRVGACIDRLYEIFAQSNPPAALLCTQIEWNEIVEAKIKDPSDVAFYKDEMSSFHNYYYETLRSDDE